jgi:hypothetical protein
MPDLSATVRLGGWWSGRPGMMSAMELQETRDYDADPETVFAMLRDKAWREEVCQATHAVDYSVDVEEADDGVVTIEITRVLPANVPEPFKSMVGDHIEIVQTETWSPAEDDVRHADIEVHVSKQPASMTGTMTLAPHGAGTRQTVTGDVRVRIPLLGRRIEPELAKAIRAALDVEAEQGRAYLDG